VSHFDGVITTTSVPFVCAVPVNERLMFLIGWRRLDKGEGLGMASLEDADSASPELGLWLKESAHGQGFGREVVASLIEWGHASLGKVSFSYLVAVENVVSRRIAENLHGEIIGHRTNPKYDSVVYRLCCSHSSDICHDLWTGASC
jgi:RimJ/RimL family protein N-acetyltransferase